MLGTVQKEPQELHAMLVSVPYLRWPKMANEEFVAEEVLKDRLTLLFLRLLIFCEQQSHCIEVLV